MNLGRKLLEVRESAGLSQAQLAELLKNKGIDVKTYTICKWEKEVSKPTVEAFLAICEICRVQDIRNTFAAPKRLLRLYNIPVSAGTGNYLDDSDYEMIEVDDLIPDSADYAVRVSGDSMTPRFVDNQIIFIHGQQVLGDGEIGIFHLSGETYLKKLGQDCLISLNENYSPIPVGPNDDFTVLGKVVG